MTLRQVRPDVNVDFQPSPRTVEVSAPSVELTIQDLVDSLRVTEDSFSEGLSFEKLIDAAGKEPLGGGVKVGITATLQNAQVSFEPRTTPATIGSVTTSSGPAINNIQSFSDSSADFIAAGVAKGSLVINFTDNSVCDVYEVVSATELLTKSLVNGTVNEFNNGDIYHIFNIIQCNISGGNLVSEDENEDPISPVVPSAFTQIVRTASSSATLQEQVDIQYSSFNGGVTFDETSPYSGINYPVGTPRQPVNNWTDALAIARLRGFPKFFIENSTSLSLSADYSGFLFFGQSKSTTLITLEPQADITGAEFRNASIQGVLDGGNTLLDCNILDITYVDGFIEKCIINSTITLSGTGQANILDCYSGVAGLSTPVLDFGGSGSSLAMRNYDGGLTVMNKTGPEPASLDFHSGQLIMHNSVTNGEIVIRGSCVWQNKDSYAGGANVTDEAFGADVIADAIKEITIDGVNFDVAMGDLIAMAKGRIVESPNGVFTFYKQDNSTVAFVLTKSGNERTAS